MYRVQVASGDIYKNNLRSVEENSPISYGKGKITRVNTGAKKTRFSPDCIKYYTLYFIFLDLISGSLGDLFPLLISGSPFP